MQAIVLKKVGPARSEGFLQSIEPSNIESHSEERARLIYSLAPWLPPTWSQGVLEALREIRSSAWIAQSEERARLICALAPWLPPTWSHGVLEALREIRSSAWIAESAVAIADWVSQDCVLEAWRTVEPNARPDHRLRVLRAIARRLPADALWRAVLAYLGGMAEPMLEEITAVARLMEPEMLQKAVDAVLAPSAESRRPDVLAALLLHASPELAASGLERARSSWGSLRPLLDVVAPGQRGAWQHDPVLSALDADVTLGLSPEAVAHILVPALAKAGQPDRMLVALGTLDGPDLLAVAIEDAVPSLLPPEAARALVLTRGISPFGSRHRVVSAFRGRLSQDSLSALLDRHFSPHPSAV